MPTPPGDQPPPPLLGTWTNLYAVVIGTLAVEVLLFWALTSFYA